MPDIAPHEIYLRHAKNVGVHMVYETAMEEGLSIVERAELVKGLRRLQRTSRKNWMCGVPMMFDGKGRRVCASAAFRAPDGILDREARRSLVRALLGLGYHAPWIIDRLGGTKVGVLEERARILALSSHAA